MSSLEASIDGVRKRVARACTRAGRHPSDVRLVAVTKGVPLESIREAASLGIRDFGENYIQEAKPKIEAFGGGIYWHMIGHIQTNKIKYIPRLFQYVHSMDRRDILEGLNRYGTMMKVLFELNLAGESSKHGTQKDGLKEMLENIGSLINIEPLGLMTMAPFTENPEDVRWVFRALRDILHEVNREFSLSMRELSMGMSSDFEVAVEEGATMVRIGTAVFGERQ